MDVSVKKIVGISSSGFEKTPREVDEFIQSELSGILKNHEDYVIFVSEIYNFYVGDFDGDRTKDGYTYFTMFPVEDIYDLDEPLQGEMFCFAEAEERVRGNNIEVAYYLSLEGGIYYAIYRDGEITEYEEAFKNFTDFLEALKRSDGRLLNEIM